LPLKGYTPDIVLPDDLEPEIAAVMAQQLRSLLLANRLDGLLKQARADQAAVGTDLLGLCDQIKHMVRDREAPLAVTAAAKQRGSRRGASGSERASGAAGSEAAKPPATSNPPLPPKPLPPSQARIAKVRSAYSKLKAECLFSKDSFCNSGIESTDWKDWIVGPNGKCSCPGSSCELAREALGFPPGIPFVDYSSSWATPKSTVAETLLQWATGVPDVVTEGKVSEAIEQRTRELATNRPSTLAAAGQPSNGKAAAGAGPSSSIPAKAAAGRGRAAVGVKNGAAGTPAPTAGNAEGIKKAVKQKPTNSAVARATGAGAAA